MFGTFTINIPLILSPFPLYFMENKYETRRMVPLFFGPRGVTISPYEAIMLLSDENQKDVVNRKNGQGPKHLKFFLLVFAKDEAQAQSPSPRRPKPKKPKSKP